MGKKKYIKVVQLDNLFKPIKGTEKRMLLEHYEKMKSSFGKALRWAVIDEEKKPKE